MKVLKRDETDRAAFGIVEDSRKQFWSSLVPFPSADLQDLSNKWSTIAVLKLVGEIWCNSLLAKCEYAIVIFVLVHVCTSSCMFLSYISGYQ